MLILALCLVVLVLLENSAFHLRRFSLWKYPKIKNKSSAVAEMGDRARAKRAEKWGRGYCAPFRGGELGPHLT